MRITDESIDDAEAYHGAPVAVQIVGRRLTEEKTMAIAEEIGRLLGNAITPWTEKRYFLISKCALASRMYWITSR